MIYGVIGADGTIQILVEITRFSPEAFVKDPAQARKRTVLIETGLSAELGWIDLDERLVPGNQT